MPLPDGIRIRVARRGDRESLYRLLGEVGVTVPVTDQSTSLAWIVSHPEIEVLVAVDPLDRVVGLLSLSHGPQLRSGGRVALVDELVVSPPQRRRGIAGELVLRAQARAKMLGCKRLEFAARDASVKDFLRRRGYRSEGAEILCWSETAS